MTRRKTNSGENCKVFWGKNFWKQRRREGIFEKPKPAMKNKDMETPTAIAFISLAIALLSFLWNIFFGYSKIMARMDIMQNDIAGIKTTLLKLENRIERLEIALHKIDIRVTMLEQRKS
jgi:hypothetical protein